MRIAFMLFVGWCGILCAGQAKANPVAGDSLRLALLADDAVNQFAQACPESGWESLRYIRAYSNQADSLQWYLETVKRVAYRSRRELDSAGLAQSVYEFALQQPLWRRPRHTEEWKSLGWLLVNAGFNLCHKLGRFREAVPYYEHALRVFTDTLHWQNPQVDQFVNLELANLYTRIGDYPSAEWVLKDLYQRAYTRADYDFAAEICNDLGLLYASWGEVARAGDSYRRGLELDATRTNPHALLQMNYAEWLIGAGRLDEALQHARRSVQTLSTQPGATEHSQSALRLGMAYSKMALVHVAQKDYPAAIQQLTLAEAAMINFFGASQRREIGKVYNAFAAIYQAQGCPEEAIFYHQRALQTVLYQYHPTSVYDLPNPATFYAENTILEALGGLATNLPELGNARAQEQALACYELMYDVEKQLRRSYLYETASLYTLEESYYRTEQAIRLALELYAQTGDTRYQEQAFVFNERCRSTLLLETLGGSQHQGLSPTHRQLERTLQRAVSDAETRLYEARAQAAPDTTLNRLQYNLQHAREAHVRWIEDLADQNPDYYRRKYGADPATPADAQEILSPKQALLAYFTGQHHLFVFVVDGTGLHTLSLPTPDSLGARVSMLLSAITQFQAQGANRSALCGQYTQLAHQLYQELLAPVEAQHPLPARLLLLPSGPLSLLPFDALLTQTPTQSCEFKDYPYLLNRYEITLGYSATLQKTLHHASRGGRLFGAFAPQFDGSGGWPALVCSAPQLSDLSAKLAGDYHGGNQATKANFKRFASRYGILHLGTHAQANAIRGDFSFVVFNTPGGGFDTLYVNELYGMQMQAELVVLSACETASGEWYQSEGVISLARGFFGAGARSLLATRWSINEQANCELVSVYYDQLARGKNKAAALQAAKQALVGKSDHFSAHPVYWAAFQLQGNDRPLGKSRSYWWIGGLALLVIVPLASRSKFVRRRFKPGGVNV